MKYTNNVLGGGNAVSPFQFAGAVTMLVGAVACCCGYIILTIEEARLK